MARIDLWVPLGNDPAELRARFHGDPARWLPPPAHERGPDHWAVEIHAGPVSRLATCALGDVYGGEAQLKRRIGWQADPEPGSEGATPSRALPSLDGTLTLRTIGEARCDLGLAATYAAPSGPIGASLGPAQLQRLAESAAAHFLHDAAARMLDGTVGAEPDDTDEGAEAGDDEDTPAASS